MKISELNIGDVIVLYMGLKHLSPKRHIVKVLRLYNNSTPLVVDNLKYPRMAIHKDLIQDIEKATREQRFSYYMLGPHEE